ncbi:hypothetical protein [Pontibacter burrus]|uniref:Uncharacterized protein n=1 Tax=Pontibacter burrus TaxID=2704466 RepID=A0A6B3LRP9_9BACT|nr:hypothetical protein [Pontibacter burrus]NEM96171.1 hypothetical protein [Pontibacter burrus]
MIDTSEFFKSKLGPEVALTPELEQAINEYARHYLDATLDHAFKSGELFYVDLERAPMCSKKLVAYKVEPVFIRKR